MENLTLDEIVIINELLNDELTFCQEMMQKKDLGKTGRLMLQKEMTTILNILVKTQLSEKMLFEQCEKGKYYEKNQIYRITGGIN